MSLPTPAKTWTHSVNNRITPFVSLNLTNAALMFGWKNFLVATMGYTVKYTCDGTTGPTSSSDHTDRWASAANCITRGAAAGNAQSFAVLTDGNGVDILLAYQGSTDDIARLSMSVGGLFIPAGTANQQPTATDETVLMSGVTFCGSTASNDRVWHISGSTDKKIFRMFIYRASVLLCSWGVEQITSLVTGMTWAVPVVGWNSIAAGAAAAISTAGGCMATSTSLTAQGSAAARIATTNVSLAGGGETYLGGLSDAFSVIAPELQAAAPIVPLAFSSGTVSFQGKLGNRIDIWFMYAHGFAQGDVAGTNQFALLGTTLIPWDGTNSPQVS